MEKMYRVLLANGSEEFCGKLGVAPEADESVFRGRLGL